MLKRLSFSRDALRAVHMPCLTIAIEGYNISYHEIECFDKYPSYWYVHVIMPLFILFKAHCWLQLWFSIVICFYVPFAQLIAVLM